MKNKNKTYGYLRGSNKNVDKNNQQYKISKVARNEKIKIDYIEDTISSTKPFEKRKIFDLVQKCEQGDTIIVSEISRLARNTEQTLAICRMCVEKGVTVRILNPEMTFSNDLNSTAVFTLFGLIAEMEGAFIKARVNAGLDAKKAQLKKDGFFISKAGKKITSLGAPKGGQRSLKLEKDHDKILDMYNKGLTKRAISQMVGCHPESVTTFLKRYPIVNGKYVEKFIKW